MDGPNELSGRPAARRRSTVQGKGTSRPGPKQLTKQAFSASCPLCFVVAPGDLNHRPPPPLRISWRRQGSVPADPPLRGRVPVESPWRSSPRMAASTSQHSLSSVKLGCTGRTGIEKRACYGHSVLIPRHCSSTRSMGLVCASNSQSSVIEPVHLPSSPKSRAIPNKSGESALILIRHGESLWNEKNLFTGCVDVPLTPKGVNEAIEAGKRICNIPVDVIYTSSLIRAQMTAMLAMMQHRRKKVPIIVHNESEQAHRWSQIYSEETKKQSIPVITAWQLNERMYGELQGLNKQETADRFGKEKVHEWRRSYDIPPPNGESLEMCAERAVAYFKDKIVPQLVAGKHVMIAAHGNSLRSIIMHLDKLTPQEVISLELATGIPMLYIFKEGKFIRRGCPAGPSEPGVYAYTKNLAQYRQKLDGMFQ